MGDFPVPSAIVLVSDLIQYLWPSVNELSVFDVLNDKRVAFSVKFQ